MHCLAGHVFPFHPRKVKCGTCKLAPLEYIEAPFWACSLCGQRAGNPYRRSPLRNSIPRVVAIHDISGIGRTSLTAVIPVLSCMGIQPIPLPTAVLSPQPVGTRNFSFLDLTENMEHMLSHWEERGDTFDGVYSGFMACPKQMESVTRCIDNLLAPGGLTVIDPVLGDDGVLIPTMTPQMVEKMRWLIKKATVITPNFTEICLLLNLDYHARHSLKDLKDYLKALSDMGPAVVVGTSMPITEGPSPEYSSVLAYERSIDKYWRVDCDYIPAHYPGTGDIFASVLTGCLMQGDSLSLAIDKAVQFTTLGVRGTFGQDVPPVEGILLERYLPTLRQPIAFCQTRLVP